MKNKKKFQTNVFIYILLFILYSCSSNENKDLVCKDSSNKFTLVLTDTIYAVTDTLSPDTYSIIDYCINDSLLYCYNSVAHSVDLISFYEKKIIKHIFLSKEGPNSVNNVSALKVINRDSILLTSENYNCIYILNSSSETVKKIDFRKEEKSETLGSFIVLNENVFNNKPIVINNFLYNFIYRFDDKECTKEICMKYNLSNEEIDTLFGYYSNEYQSSYFSSLESPSILSANNNIYIAFPPINKIDIYDINGNYIESKCSYSKYYKEVIPINENSDMQEQVDFLTEQPYFVSLSYDKFRHIFYRIYKHKMPLLNNEGLTNDRWFSGKYSVVLFDNNLDRIGEFLFPKGVFVPVYFVSEKGLNIAILTKNEGKIAFFVFNKINL